MKSLFLCCAFVLVCLSGNGMFPAKMAVAVQDDRVMVRVETVDGKVAWSEIVAAVSKEVGFEVPVLEQAPAGNFDINAPSARLVMYGLNKTLLPAFRISVDRSKGMVVVRVNKTEIAALRKQWEEARRARAKAADEAAGRVFGLRPFRKDASLEDAGQIVVLVHGFNSSTRYMGTLAKKIEKAFEDDDARCEVACFDYAAREGVVAAATALEEELAAITEANRECAISLVTHSMGGLVARSMIESEDFDMPQLIRLVMVAPPNHGTNLASLPSQAGVFDFMLGQVDQSGLRQTLQTLVAEANLAVDELRPDSDLLKTLNARQRNASVDYSILLGKTGVLSKRESKLLDQLVHQLSRSNQAEVIQAGRDLLRLKELLSPEIVSGQGDGVVSLASAKLDGVEDSEVLDFQHSDLLKENAKGQRRVIREILERLK